MSSASLNYYELEPEGNSFYSLVADITHRCNMNCANCYVPNRKIPDMDKEKLFHLLKRLPSKSEIRLMGGEPTLRDDLPEIISQIRLLGHRPALITNGLRLSDPSYTGELRKAGLFIVNISLNGGDDDEIYKIIDGGCYAEKKMLALENLAKSRFFINTNTILVKGLSGKLPLNIYKRLKRLKIKRAVMRFRNIGALGRRMSDGGSNYTYEEIVRLVSKAFNLKMEDTLRFNNIDGHREKNTILFPVEKSIFVKITNWALEESGLPDLNSRRRGRITQDFKIAPFFEHVKLNEFGY